MKWEIYYYKILYYLRNYQEKHNLPIKVQKFGSNRVTFTREQRDEILIDAIINKKPLLAGKFGGAEMFAMRTAEFYDRRNEKKVCEQLCSCAGFFPNEVQLLDKFNQVMKGTAKEIDLLEKWDKPCEDYFIDKYCESLKGFSAAPVYKGEENPWTRFLAGKKVLIISPFEKSIRSQYKKRKLLFSDPEVLPEFELLTIKAVQTQGDEVDPRFSNWFEALDFMCGQVDELDYDIAFLGCGAYGLPLGAHIKRMGKIAIHLGGGLQLMFGIWGKRWESKPEVCAMRNEYWVRPLEEERIKGMEKVEGGCYW